MISEMPTAVAEAVQRPTTRFVPAKTDEQLDLQALHRVRSRLDSERTAVINRLSAGTRDHRSARTAFPSPIATRHSGQAGGRSSPRMVRIVTELAGDWRRVDERIETVTGEIEALAKSDDSCRRVMPVPGIGPIISSAMVAAIGNGVAFARGWDVSAWLGLVPKQMSTGDRTILGRISKRGNVTYGCSSCRQPGSFCCGQRIGLSTASGPGSLAPLSACIQTFWPRPSPTSWRGSHGQCWHKSGTYESRVTKAA
jgi:transposase